MEVAKPFEISKKLVWQAYLNVKSNGRNLSPAILFSCKDDI